MKYKMLGKSGLRVSELCLGAMTFGENWGYGSDEEGSRQCFEAFVEAGGNFIDTANNYTEGNSEKLLGKFIHENRERYVIASKCTLCSPMGSKYPGDPNATGNNRKHLREELEHTLKRLNTDYLDVLYIHGWDFATPVEEVMQTLNDFVRSGKVNYLGISNTPAYIVARANTIAEERGWSRFDVYEGQYNLLSRTIELEVMPMANDLGLTVTCWQALAGSLLTGDEESINTRVKVGYTPPTDKQWKVIHVVSTIAKEVGATNPEVALNWLRQKPGVVIPILGSRSAKHLKANFKCLDWELSDEQINTLNEATKIEFGYPQREVSKIISGMIYNNMLDKIIAPERFPDYFKY